MSIHDLIEKIEAEVMTYNHVRDTETHMVADLVVLVKNMLGDMESQTKADVPQVTMSQASPRISK